MLASYRTLADALAPHARVFWSRYRQEAEDQVAFKDTPGWLSRQRSVTILTHAPPPPSWLDTGNPQRVIQTRLPHQLHEPMPAKPVDQLWWLDCPAALLSPWRRLQQRWWRWPPCQRFDFIAPPLAQRIPLGEEYLFLPSERLSPAERELVSEVAQVVAIKRASPVRVMLSGTPPPPLRGVTFETLSDEAGIQQRITQARAVISDSWHRLLSAAHLDRPLLALTSPDSAQLRHCQAMGFAHSPLLREPLTQAILCLAPSSHPRLTNGLERALGTLLCPGVDLLGQAPLSRYTTP
ncbi:hypothetical protein [Ferrimonas balearica]|uniref:hypothetical protein n=1 Tax=Ferrimonas balearica TaxID=44012 RepID=UPI001C99DBF7|nr:hypothetical protein [Ferrimonas balearica]MBY5994087.1 hypothetical protein [Ferrimonas balearica]